MVLRWAARAIFNFVVEMQFGVSLKLPTTVGITKPLQMFHKREFDDLPSSFDGCAETVGTMLNCVVFDTMRDVEVDDDAMRPFYVY